MGKRRLDRPESAVRKKSVNPRQGSAEFSSEKKIEPSPGLGVWGGGGVGWWGGVLGFGGVGGF